MFWTRLRGGEDAFFLGGGRQLGFLDERRHRPARPIDVPGCCLARQNPRALPPQPPNQYAQEENNGKIAGAAALAGRAGQDTALGSLRFRAHNPDCLQRSSRHSTHLLLGVGGVNPLGLLGGLKVEIRAGTVSTVNRAFLAAALRLCLWGRLAQRWPNHRSCRIGVTRTPMSSLTARVLCSLVIWSSLTGSRIFSAFLTSTGTTLPC